MRWVQAVSGLLRALGSQGGSRCLACDRPIPSGQQTVNDQGVIVDFPYCNHLHEEVHRNGHTFRPMPYPDGKHRAMWGARGTRV